jgi:hypothetical protein
MKKNGKEKTLLEVFKEFNIPLEYITLDNLDVKV